MNIDVNPEPPPDDRAAVLEAVRKILSEEAGRATVPAWVLAGWTQRRAGVTDLPFGRRRWTMSARLAWGGREFPGLTGRGDAK